MIFRILSKYGKFLTKLVTRNVITMFHVVCSKLCGDNLQRSTKQTGLSEQFVYSFNRPLYSWSCQRRQSSHYLQHRY